MKAKEYNIIVSNFSDGLYRFILKNIKDEYKAQDIVQDSFEILWINHEKVSFDKAKSFLFKVGYNKMIDTIRKDSKTSNVNEVIEREDALSFENDFDIQDALHLALEKLSSIQKSVVLLRDYEGYSYEEIAEITNLNESQVKVYIFRARKYLKNYLQNFRETVKK